MPDYDGLGSAGYPIDLDEKGNMAVTPKFVKSKNFQNGMAQVTEKKLYGMIDKSGNYIIPPNFNNIEVFNGDMARARIGKWGYVDKTGNWLVSPQFDGLQDISEDLAAAKQGKAWGYIDKTGKWIIQPTFLNAEPFHNGRARVSSTKGSWHLIDKSGTKVGYNSFQSLKDFEGTFARAKTEGKRPGYSGGPGWKLIAPMRAFLRT